MIADEVELKALLTTLGLVLAYSGELGGESSVAERRARRARVRGWSGGKCGEQRLARPASLAGRAAAPGRSHRPLVESGCVPGHHHPHPACPVILATSIFLRFSQPRGDGIEHPFKLGCVVVVLVACCTLPDSAVRAPPRRCLLQPRPRAAQYLTVPLFPPPPLLAGTPCNGGIVCARPAVAPTRPSWPRATQTRTGTATCALRMFATVSAVTGTRSAQATACTAR